MFFNYRTSNFNVSARITTQYNHKTKVPEAITNIICLSFSELENSVFLDLVLLRFTPVTSYSFSCPPWRSSFTATLVCTCFWICLPSGIQSGEETDVGTFILLLFRNKQGAWHKGTQLMKGFDFRFTTTKNPCDILLAMIQHFHKYSFQMRESHQTSALRAETSSRFQSDPPENQFWHTDNSYLPQKKKAIFFLCRLDCLQSAFSLVTCLGFSCSNFAKKNKRLLVVYLPVFFSEWVQRSPTLHGF